MHDVGKLGIPDSILLKPGKLTEEEFSIMKNHTLIGADIIGNDPWFSIACDIALYHHENWDGTGYPEGISGESIPLPARIVSIADVYDTLISKRVYKESWDVEEAVNEIRALSGRKFDPHLVELFVSLHAQGILPQNIMSLNFDIKFIPMKRYLRVEVNGTDTTDTTIKILKEISVYIDKKSFDKVMTVSKLSPLSIKEASEQASSLELINALPPCKLAWVDCNESSYKSNKIVEASLISKGNKSVKVFDNKQDAVKWLLPNR